MKIPTAIVISAVALCEAACSQPSVPVGELDDVMVLPAIPNRDIDLLFVIDNSPSMLDKQVSLINSFPKMMDALGTLEGGLPNLHIGVVTSDMGALGSKDAQPGPSTGSCIGNGYDGKLQHNAPELGTALYIEDIANSDGTRTRNYTGELRDVFAQIATVEAHGCGFEQHLASMRRALVNSANGDFLRPDANLGVIILADEDDCSMTHSSLIGDDTAALGPLESFRCTRFGVTCDEGGITSDAINHIGAKSGCHSRADSPYVEDVAPFVDFLSTIKTDPRAVMVAAIVGDRAPVATELQVPVGGGTAIPALAHSCMYQGNDGSNILEVADPAVRISQLVDAFPGRGTLESVCNADLTLSLSSIGYAAKQLAGDPCVVATLVDTSSEPGIQPFCEVVDDTNAALPACDAATTTDCWRFVADAALCPASPNNLRFQIVRSAAPSGQSYTRARCVTAH